MESIFETAYDKITASLERQEKEAIEKQLKEEARGDPNPKHMRELILQWMENLNPHELEEQYYDTLGKMPDDSATVEYLAKAILNAKYKTDEDLKKYWESGPKDYYLEKGADYSEKYWESKIREQEEVAAEEAPAEEAPVAEEKPVEDEEEMTIEDEEEKSVEDEG